MSEVFFEEKLIDDRDNYTFYTFHNEKFVFPKTKIKTIKQLKQKLQKFTGISAQQQQIMINHAIVQAQDDILVQNLNILKCDICIVALKQQQGEFQNVFTLNPISTNQKLTHQQNVKLIQNQKVQGIPQKEKQFDNIRSQKPLSKMPTNGNLLDHQLNSKIQKQSIKNSENIISQPFNIPPKTKGQILPAGSSLDKKEVGNYINYFNLLKKESKILIISKIFENQKLNPIKQKLLNQPDLANNLIDKIINLNKQKKILIRIMKKFRSELFKNLQLKLL